MLNLIHVRSFLAVIDMQGIRAAASALAVSPSTIVEHIRQLEEQLAIPLFERENRSLKPSRHGLRLLPYARALVKTATRARELITEPRLRVVAASNIGIYLLQPSTEAFRRQNDLEVEIWIGPNPQVAERIERGEADIAVMEWWDNRSGFSVINWKLEPLVLIVAPDHIWTLRDSIYAEELANVMLLGGEAGTGTGRVLKSELGEIAALLRIQTGFGSTEAVKKAVQAGHGASIVMYSSVAEEVANGRLAIVPIKDASLSKQLKLVLPDNLLPDSIANLFVRTLSVDQTSFQVSN